MATNTIYVGQGDDHPGLYRKALFIPAGDEHWLREDLKLNPGEEQTLQARIRYRQPLQDVTLYKTTDGLYLAFSEPQRAITPGQFAVWYIKEELTGSGVIAT